MNDINNIISSKKNGYKDYIFHKADLDWGWSIIIMDKKGKSTIQIYLITENTIERNIALQSLSVCIEDRNKGLATKILDLAIDICKELGFSKVYLWVEKDTWQMDWYIRRGFETYDYEEKHAENEDCINYDKQIWLRKDLGNNNNNEVK